MLSEPAPVEPEVEETEEVDTGDEDTLSAEDTVVDVGANGNGGTAVEDEETDDVEADVEEEEDAPAKASGSGRSIRGAEGARLIALNMALNGTPRDETARYLSQNFDLDNQEELLDEVYARVGD
jgi:hypothetical protein